MKKLIADRTSLVDASGIRKVFALAAELKDPISFSIGRKRDLLYDGLKDSFEVVQPAGAFHPFIGAPGGSGTEFVTKAVQNNVLVIPGNVFSEEDSHFRISFAATDEDIRQGVDILRALV